MNGRVSRRIRRAARKVLEVGTGLGPSMGSTHREIVKTLKREYRQSPYHHRRASSPYYVETHAEASSRYFWVTGPK